MEHYFTNNNDLKSEFRTIIYKYEDYSLEFTSDLGVFSKDKVDFGSRLLMETYFKNGRKNINLLDLGCGYGIIGLSMARIMNIKPTMVDVNKRALHLASMNAKALNIDANIYESIIYSNVEGKYDVIMTNPPIRTGKEMVTEFILKAKDFLAENGELWFVMKKDHGAKSMIEKAKNVYSSVEVLEKSKGFYIILCK